MRGFRLSPRAGKELLTAAMDGRATVAGQDRRLSVQASMTLYAGLCILAVLATLVAVLGIAGSDPRTSDAALDVLDQIGGASLVDLFDGPIQDLVGNRQLAVALFAVGLVATAALSSLYVRALHRGSPPERGLLHMLARVAVAQLVVLIGLCVIATGPVADAIGNVSGLSNDAITAWDFGKWPVLLILAFIAFGTILRSVVIPSASQVLALLVWVLAITGFVMFLASFSHFQDTYGIIGSALVLLIWLTMFSVLYYVTPDLRALGGGGQGARALAARGHVARGVRGTGDMPGAPRLERPDLCRGCRRHCLRGRAVDYERHRAARRATQLTSLA